MQVQNIGFKNNNKRNGKSRGDRHYLSIDPVQGRLEHKGRAAHRARLADLIAQSREQY